MVKQKKREKKIQKRGASGKKSKPLHPSEHPQANT